MSDSKREALAKAAVRAAWPGTIDPCPQAVPQGCWLRVADFILAREAEREGPLVEALETIGRKPSQCADRGGPFCGDVARSALAAYRALDAPPQRTLAEVAKDVVGPCPEFADKAWWPVPKALLDELAEALKREEGKR